MDQVEINVILHVSTADGNEVDITDLEIEKPAEPITVCDFEV